MKPQKMSIKKCQKAIAAVAKGDLEAYEIIYDYYFPIIYQFILKWVKDESFIKKITQDVFVAVWEKRINFKTLEDLQTCLFSIAKDAALKGITINKRYTS